MFFFEPVLKDSPLTVEELAVKAYIRLRSASRRPTAGEIFAYLSGDRSPNVDVAIRICKALGFEVVVVKNPALDVPVAPKKAPKSEPSANGMRKKVGRPRKTPCESKTA